MLKDIGKFLVACVGAVLVLGLIGTVCYFAFKDVVPVSERSDVPRSAVPKELAYSAAQVCCALLHGQQDGELRKKWLGSNAASLFPQEFKDLTDLQKRQLGEGPRAEEISKRIDAARKELLSSRFILWQDKGLPEYDVKEGAFLLAVEGTGEKPGKLTRDQSKAILHLVGEAWAESAPMSIGELFGGLHYRELKIQVPASQAADIEKRRERVQAQVVGQFTGRVHEANLGKHWTGGDWKEHYPVADKVTVRLVDMDDGKVLWSKDF